MHDVMRQLHDDHHNVARLLQFIRAETGKPDDVAPDYVQLHQVMHYLTQYPDVFHHPREDLVFEKLLQRDSSARASINRLKSEHEDLGDSGKRLRARLREKIDGRRYQRRSLCKELDEYAGFLQAHMEKEEKRLFPLAKLLLTDDDWQDVAERIRLREDPLFGDTASRPYVALLNRIERQ